MVVRTHTRIVVVYMNCNDRNKQKKKKTYKKTYIVDAALSKVYNIITKWR